MEKILVHYGEIALKGHNRPLFEKRLEENIRLSLRCRVMREQGRLVAETDDRSQAAEALSKTFGIEWFSFCRETVNDIGGLKKECLKEVTGKERSFKVECSRSWKDYPMTSIQVNELVGEEIIKKHGLKVSLERPEKTVYVEIGERKARVFSEKLRGPGGLPVGSSGRVLCLFSGGIDSPVAAWMMMKRGCNVDYLHFHALRDTQELKESKILSLAEELRTYCPFSKLYVVPYYPFDLAARGGKYNLVLFRRFMMKVASRLADRIKAKAIVTGESVGQVASQTLDNMACIGEACSFPILRPLVGMDKEEIISMAKEIGTYGHSIEPYKDCCSIIARHPATRASLEKMKSMEEKLGLGKVEEECMGLLERV